MVPTTRSVARMEAAAAAAAAAEEQNPDAAEGAADAAAVAPDAAAEGEASREPDEGEASREPNEGEASREPDEGEVSREPEAAEGSRAPGAAVAWRNPIVDAAQWAIVPYAEDIDQYLRAREADPRRRPIINYDQAIQRGNIRMNMRGTLVNWLVGVAFSNGIRNGAVHHAVSYVDRFLSRNAINRDNLQLLGAAALFVASKYEDIRHPKARWFSSITNDTYTTRQVVEMEADILRTLNWDVGSPTAITFLRRFLTTCCGGNRSRDRKLELMCNYLAELSLLDAYYIRFLPSIVAAACLFVAKFTINPKTRPWNLTVQRNTGYKVSDIKDCVHAIHNLQQADRNSNLKAVRDKYGILESVSIISSPQKITASFLKDLKYASG
uniref:Uncharacterized protein n=1 Tax=Leersia perrieri TaxID=77586 RepID=A0A0D9VR14_9ORYZ